MKRQKGIDKIEIWMDRWSNLLLVFLIQRKWTPFLMDILLLWQHLNPQRTCPRIYWHLLSVTTQILHQRMTPWYGHQSPFMSSIVALKDKNLTFIDHKMSFTAYLLVLHITKLFAVNRYEYGLVRKPLRSAMVIMLWI